MTASVELFEAERTRLVGLAYRMLGTPDDAHDVVQEAWLRFAATNQPIDNPAAWLTTVTTRLAIDKLRSAAHRREQYVGPWLADPILDLPSAEPDPEDQSILAESLSLAFLAVMERLTPNERAAFLLHDVFGMPFSQIAEALGKSEPAARQLARRARSHISDERPRFAPDPHDVEELAMHVLAAAQAGDIAQLQTFLAEDVVHVSDGGPHFRAARKPVIGRERVARFLCNLAQRPEPGLQYYLVRANGQLAIFITQHDLPFILMTITFVDRVVTSMCAVRNPDKLETFFRSWKVTQGA